MNAWTEAILSAGEKISFPGPAKEDIPFPGSAGDLKDITPKPMISASAETQPNILTGSRLL
jgi:hypothetical protein